MGRSGKTNKLSANTATTRHILLGEGAVVQSELINELPPLSERLEAVKLI